MYRLASRRGALGWSASAGQKAIGGQTVRALRQRGLQRLRSVGASANTDNAGLNAAECGSQCESAGRFRAVQHCVEAIKLSWECLTADTAGKHCSVDASLRTS